MPFTFDHEVLTDVGWVSVGDLTQTHNVAVLLEKEALAYRPVVDIEERRHSDGVVSVTAAGVDLELTPDHPLFVARQDFTITKAATEPLSRLPTLEEGNEDEQSSPETDTKPDNIVEDDLPTLQPADNAEVASNDDSSKFVGLVFKNDVVVDADPYDTESIEKSIEYIVEKSRIPREFLLHFNKDQSAALMGMLFQENESILATSRDFANDISIIAFNAGYATIISPEDVVIPEPTEASAETEPTEEDGTDASGSATKTAPGTYVPIILLRNTAPVIVDKNIQQNQYDGPVYNVKSNQAENIIYVRRNGKAVWIYGSPFEVPVQDDAPAIAPDEVRVEELD